MSPLTRMREWMEYHWILTSLAGVLSCAIMAAISKWSEKH